MHGDSNSKFNYWVLNYMLISLHSLLVHLNCSLCFQVNFFFGKTNNILFIVKKSLQLALSFTHDVAYFLSSKNTLIFLKNILKIHIYITFQSGYLGPGPKPTQNLELVNTSRYTIH
jgi:hypothetical protein